MKTYKFYFLLYLIFIVNTQVYSQINLTNNNLCNELQRLYDCQSDFKANRIIKKIISIESNYDTLSFYIKNYNFHTNKKVKTGYIEWEYELDSIPYMAMILVPGNYSPKQKYKISFILHGAVMNLNPFSAKSYINAKNYNTDSLDRIIIYPSGWMMSPWWCEKQVNNMQYLIRRLKQEYNIDENNIHLSGISDGGTGIIYQANLNITPWASFRPYISNPFSMERLSNYPVFYENLGNRPYLFISTDGDELFPPENIKLFLKRMSSIGNCYEFYLAKGYKHDINWFPAYRDTIENFLMKNPRNPLPDSLNWNITNPEYGRNQWLVINKLSTNPNKNQINKLIIHSNQIVKEVVGSATIKVEENTVYVSASNIINYTLLLSPKQFDFKKEIVIYTNGELSFKSFIQKDPKLLLNWFYKDLDREMLFGNEIKIRL